MYFKTLIAALPIAVAVIASPASGTATAAPAPSCGFNFHTGTVYTQHGAVIGGGSVECATTPAAFSITLTVRFKPRGGDWVARGGESSTQIPSPRLNLATYANCENGLWKGVATIWETSASGATTETSFDSAPAIITC